MFFFINYGYYLKLDIFDFSKVNNYATKDLANYLSELHTTIKVQLKEAQG